MTNMEYCSYGMQNAVQQAIPLTPVVRGEQKCAPGYTWGAGVQACFAVHYIFSGKGTFYCGPNKFTLHAGQIFVIFPHTVVKYTADEADPWHYAWVAFCGQEGMRILAKMGLTPLSPVCTPENEGQIVRILSEMPAECPLELSENLRFTSQIYAFLSLLCKKEEGHKNTENVYFRAAKVYVKSHYSEPITVDSLAEYIGISRKYLYAIFKRNGDLSPKDYIVDYRIQKACDFLKDPHVSVGQAAYSVGYADPLAFSKMFKKKKGVSPTEYREQTE